VINLHGIVRGAINAIHPDIQATLYRSAGMTLSASGESIPAYDETGEAVKAQTQSESASALYHADRVGMENVSRKMYLFSGAALSDRVASIVRPVGRTGDLLKLDDGTWWLITAVTEDFSRSGWVSVRVTLQVKPPAFAVNP
jgi:hypothetical protein